MKIGNWNTLFEKRDIQKNYIPLTIWFGKEIEYAELLHYRIVDRNSIIECHFEKTDGALKRFNIVNLDRDTQISNNSFNFDTINYNAELGSLYCNKTEWENKENLFNGNFISDTATLTVEKYKDAFKINFKYASIDSIQEGYCKLSEGFITSISKEGKILSIIILNFNDFDGIW